MKTFKISEIDLIKGIVTPHQRDLDDLTKKNIDVLRKVKDIQIKKINDALDSISVELDLGEDWAISKEFFPGVELIVLYQYYGDEFGAGVAEDEIQVVYSGDNVLAVSGEDLMHFTEILLNFMSRIVTGNKIEFTFSGLLSNMMKIALKERKEPFFMINKSNYIEIADFIGAKLIDSTIALTNELSDFDFIFEFAPIPDLIIEINGKNKEINFKVTGQSVSKLQTYDTERIVLMGINQCLRKIKYILKLESPLICNLMFSGYYKKKFPEQFP